MSPIESAVFDAKRYDREALDAFASSAPEPVAWRYHEFRLTPDTVAAAAGARSVVVFVNDQLNEPCLTGLSRLGVQHIALRCAGFNNVDVRAAKSLGLTVTRVPAYSPHAVAEHAVGLLLTLNRKIHRAYNRVREHNFSLNGLVGFDLFGKTVGIIGTGKIGKVAAEIFNGFKTKVVAHDPFPDQCWARAQGVTYLDLIPLLSTSDIISLHVPLLPETHHLIREETLAAMKPGATLVNTGRGKLIDTTALISALKRGRLAGVALDVYEEEEGLFFQDHSDSVVQDDELNLLLTFPNVLVTAHQAFLTHEALHEIARVTHENILRVGTGKSPLPGTAL